MINKIHDIGGVKTRWGVVDQASYTFSYPTDFLYYSLKEVVDMGDMIPEVECSLQFTKNSVVKIANYTCKRHKSKFSLKAFLRQMRKATSATFEDFPKCVIINDDKFRLCSINYGEINESSVRIY